MYLAENCFFLITATSLLTLVVNYGD